MAYFDGIKVGDRVWDCAYGWGVVTKIQEKMGYPIVVEFSDCLKDEYNYNGFIVMAKNQTLFWNEVKIEPPKKPKPQKIELKNDYIEIVRRGVTDDSKIQFESYKQLCKTAKLLALRDQECPDSRGYKFEKNKDNCFIKYSNGVWGVIATHINYIPSLVYFKTRKDAQKICDILNSGKFDL